MLTTEEDAKRKICPHLLGSTETDNIGDGSTRTQPRDWPQCIASNCMAWREWGGQKQYVHDDEAAKSWIGRGWVKIGNAPDGRVIVQMPLLGYCGLAGKPE